MLSINFARYIKNKNREVLTDGSKTKDRSEEYFEQLLNEKNLRVVEDKIINKPITSEFTKVVKALDEKD